MNRIMTTLPPAALLFLSMVFFQATTTPLVSSALEKQGGDGIAPRYKRIVSTAPSITEILFALGRGDRVVGVTTYCNYPPEARNKPKIGGFTSPNLELVLQQRPDLVIILEERTDLAGKLRPFGTSTLILRHQNLAGIYESILRLADHLGIPERGTKLASEIQNALHSIQQSVRELPKRKVLFLVGRNPGTLTDLHTVGGGSYLGELIELAGGSNIFAETGAMYPKISIEGILVRNPEVIIDMSHGRSADENTIRAIRALWKAFPSIEAVRTGRVHVTSEDFFVVPGPRVSEAVKSLAKIIHGREFQ